MIYNTAAADDIKSIWLRAYQPERMRHSLNGPLWAYLKTKKIRGKKQIETKVTLKTACEAVYFSLKLFFISNRSTRLFALEYFFTALSVQLGQLNI